MIFEVNRTTAWNNECPHEKCFPMKLKEVEELYFSSPEEYDQKFVYSSRKWMNEGTNHRINDKGHILRDHERKTWGIKITGLKNFIDFCNSINEEIIIRESYINPEITCLEIYDGYRE